MSDIPWAALHEEALLYDAFLDRYATPAQRARWDASHQRIVLTEAQISLLEGFRRRMPVVVLTGAWCGDCINQCPILEHIARASSTIELKFLDRDARPELRDRLAINGGHRVPVVVFLSEDFQEVARFGDRPLSTYRRMAVSHLGPSCPTGLVAPDDEALAAAVADWLDQFERAQLILRLSPRLRQRHGD